MRSTRLSYQILAVFVVVVVLALGVSGWAITTMAQRIVADNVQRGQQELVRRIAEEIDLEMEGIRPILSQLAETIGAVSMDPAGSGAELARYQARFPVISEAYVVAASGQQIARTDGLPLESVATTYGFQVAREGHDLVSDVYLRQDGLGPMLTVYLPIEDGGDVMGVLVADVNFARVQAVLEGLALTRNETAVVFAPNGRGVAHSRMAELAEPPALTDPMLIEALVRGPAGVLEGYTDELGRTVVGVHAPAGELDWGVVIQTPVRELASEVATLRRIMIGVVLGGVALAVAAGWLMARRLAQPIGQLAQASGRIAAGDLEARSGLPYGSGELGQLARSFDQMAEALQAQRAETDRAAEALQRYAVRLEVMHEIDRAILAHRSPQAIAQAALDPIRLLVPCTRASVAEFDFEAGRGVILAVHADGETGVEAGAHLPLESLGIAQGLQQGEIHVVEDTLALSHPSPVEQDLLDEGIRSYISAPLIAQGELIGSLNIGAEEPGAYDDEQIQVVAEVAGPLAIAIQHARLHEQVQRHAAELEQRVDLATEEIRLRADELAALYEVSRDLVATLDLDALLPVIAQRVTDTLKADRCAVFLLDDRTGVLRARATHGYMAERLADFSYRPGEEVVGQAYATAQSQYVPDLNRAPDLPRRDEIRAILAVPLVSATTGPLGVLSVTSLRPGAFASGQRQLLETMAGQIAGAIESAHLFRQSRAWAEELAVLNELSQTLTAHLSVEQVLIEAYRGASRLLDAANFYVTLYDSGRDEIVSALKIVEGQVKKPIPTPRGGLTDYLIETRQPLLIPNKVVERAAELGLKQVPLVVGRVSESWLGVPIVLGKRVLGTMVALSYTTPDAYDEHHRDLLLALANQAAIAINNAQLYRRSEQHAMELAVLYEVGKEITATLDLDAMLQTVAKNTVRLVEADKSLILLIDTRKEKLVKVVGHNYSQAQLDGHTFKEFQDGLSGWVLREKAPTSTPDIQADERNRGRALANARASKDRSVAVAPLLIGDEALGTLTAVNGQGKRPFAPADLNLVTMLAGQAAIAIQNARLYEAAQEADRLKSAFLASMSHELRTPLNSIIGFTGILLQGLVGPLNDEQAKQLGMVMNSARHLLDLITDVLDISKIEAGQLEIASEHFDMRNAIERAVQTVTPLADKKGLPLVVEIAPDVGQIVGDRRRVEQILINLLNNAIKFAEEGEIRIESQVDDGWLATRVIDSGIGIKSEDVPKLFRPFRQIDTGVARRHEGTGLGLSICKRLVEMMGGEIWIESEWGVGSTFTFTLPV